MTKAPRFDDPVYRANHRRVHRQRGRAAEQKCVRCPASATEWAQVHTENGTDPWADFVPLCHRCHVTYDRGGKRGTPMSAEGRAKISRSKLGWNPSPETRARMSAGAKRRTDLRHDISGRFYNKKSSAKPAGKLTANEVIEIRLLIDKHEMSLRAIGRQYNIGYTTIANIRDGVTWAWLKLLVLRNRARRAGHGLVAHLVRGAQLRAAGGLDYLGLGMGTLGCLPPLVKNRKR